MIHYLVKSLKHFCTVLNLVRLICIGHYVNSLNNNDNNNNVTEKKEKIKKARRNHTGTKYFRREVSRWGPWIIQGRFPPKRQVAFWVLKCFFCAAETMTQLTERNRFSNGQICKPFSGSSFSNARICCVSPSYHCKLNTIGFITVVWMNWEIWRC